MNRDCLKLVLILSTGITGLLTLTASDLTAEDRGLPAGVSNSQNPKDVPLTPAQSLAKITVPDGFHVTLFAAEPDIQQPIAFEFDDRGRVWVAECFSHPNWTEQGQDRVTVLTDQDGDGQHDQRVVFWDEGRYLSGIAVGYGGVFLCNTPELIFIPDRDGDLQPDGPPEVLLDGWTNVGANNVFNNLRFGPDGWLYGCIGQNGNSMVGPPGTPPEERVAISRGVWRYHPLQKRFEVVALGAVNPWGLDFNEHGEMFFSNCVLPHLWHLLPGAYYERRKGERDNPYAYQRLQPCCDHRHWADGNWTASRGSFGEHSSAGGGHAHTGSMIYQGDNWPDKYRGTYFVGNLHGNRINNDYFWRKGSGYVASHRPDFLFGHDPWFRCLSQKYGPDGGVLITDWHDLGECHDNDGSHRSSGRIYKVVYGDVVQPKFDLGTATDRELVEYQTHKNAWFARHARRLLIERSAERDLEEAKPQLKTMLAAGSVPSNPTSTRLRAMWTLFGIGSLTEAGLLPLLSDSDEHVRKWAVRFLVDGDTVSSSVAAKLADHAESESSAIVRLYLAAALQRLEVKDRYPLAAVLVTRSEDAEDANIPLMLWYGIEPIVAADLASETGQAVELLTACQIPIVRQNIARRMAEGG